MTQAADWLTMAERGSIVGMRFIVWCYRFFGRGLCQLLLAPIITYFFVTHPIARAASRQYLRRLHHHSRYGSPFVREPGLWQSFLHFHEFGLNILDRVGFLLGRDPEVKVVVHGTEHLDDLIRERRGAILLSAHLGSFDALRLVADRTGVVVKVVMFLRNARMINSVFGNLNPRLASQVINIEPGSPRAVFEIRNCLLRGEFVGLLGDRVGAGDGGRIERVAFLEQPVAIPQGPFQLAAMLRCPLLFIVALRVDRTAYEIFVEPLDSGDPQGSMRQYVDRLEAYCRRAPYQWFNFFDVWAGRATPSI
jgi:predicted LPLAT superfamily acyltransferase